MKNKIQILLFLFLTNCSSHNNLIKGKWVLIDNMEGENSIKYNDLNYKQICDNPYKTKYFFENDSVYKIDMGDVMEEGKYYVDSKKNYRINWKNDTFVSTILKLNRKMLIFDNKTDMKFILLKCTKNH